MQKDFQGWYTMMAARGAAPTSGDAASADGMLTSGSRSTAVHTGEAVKKVSLLDTGTAAQGKSEIGLVAERSLPGQRVPAVRTVGSAGQLAAQARESSGVAMSNGQDQVPSKGKDFPEEVLRAAGPFLTGDPTADEDILGFYLVRHNMLHGGN